MENRPDPSVAHIFLYAKNWYKTDLSRVEALKVLVSKRSSLPTRWMDNRSIYDILFICLRQMVVKDPIRMFQEFIERFHCGIFPLMEGYDDDSDEARFNFIIKHLCFSDPKDLLFELTLELFDPKIQRLLDEHSAQLKIKEWKGLGWGNKATE